MRVLVRRRRQGPRQDGALPPCGAPIVIEGEAPKGAVEILVERVHGVPIEVACGPRISGLAGSVFRFFASAPKLVPRVTNWMGPFPLALVPHRDGFRVVAIDLGASDPIADGTTDLSRMLATTAMLSALHEQMGIRPRQFDLGELVMAYKTFPFGTATCRHTILSTARDVQDPTLGPMCGAPPISEDPSFGCAVPECSATGVCITSPSSSLHGTTGYCSDNSHGSDRPGACYHQGCSLFSCVELPNASECAPWVAANTHGCPADLLTCDISAGAALPGAPIGCMVSPSAGFCLIGGFCIGAGPSASNVCVICDPFASTTGFVIDPALDGVRRIDPITGACRFCRNGADLPCPA